MTLKISALKLTTLFLLLIPSFYLSASPTLIAHRGASAYRPENTMEAFELAYQMGAKALEFDCKLSKDGEVIILHHNLEETTSLKGQAGDYTLAELKAADAGSSFNKQFCNACIPTLEEVLTFAKGKDLKLFIELKDKPIEVAKRTTELLHQYDMLDQVFVISFQHHLLTWLHHHHPEVPLGFSSPVAYPSLAEDAKKVNAKGVMLLESELSNTLVDELLGQGLEVWTFTINDPSFYQHDFFPKLTAYCSNFPDLPSRSVVD